MGGTGYRVVIQLALQGLSDMLPTWALAFIQVCQCACALCFCEPSEIRTKVKAVAVCCFIPAQCKKKYWFSEVINAVIGPIVLYCSEVWVNLAAYGAAEWDTKHEVGLNSYLLSKMSYEIAEAPEMFDFPGLRVSGKCPKNSPEGSPHRQRVMSFKIKICSRTESPKKQKTIQFIKTQRKCKVHLALDRQAT